MRIVNTICEAIYAELIRIETNLHKEGRKEIKRILVDFPTAMDIRRDGHLYYWGVNTSTNVMEGAVSTWLS